MSQNPHDHESPQESEGGHRAPQFGDGTRSGSTQPDGAAHEEASHDGAPRIDAPAGEAPAGDAPATGGSHRAAEAGDPRVEDRSDAPPQAPHHEVPRYEAPRYREEAPQAGSGQGPSSNGPYGRPSSPQVPSYGAPGPGQNQNPYLQNQNPYAPNQNPYVPNQNPYLQQPGQGGTQWQQNQNPYTQQPGQGAPQWNAGQPQYTARQSGPDAYGRQGGWGGPGAAATGRVFDISGRLQRLLLVSAGLFLLLGILQVLGRTTLAWALHLQETAGMLGVGVSGLNTSATWALTPGNILSWIITLGLYALVLFLLNRQPRAGRITGIVLAVLGGLGAFGALVNAFNYSWVGFFVAVTALAFLAVNVLWIVRAARTR